MSTLGIKRPKDAGLRIRVFSASSSAPTPLAAFDRALQCGNVHDTNLIVLSSVVPVGAEVVRELVAPDEFVVGDRLYCVMAQERASEPGLEAWAGLGWATNTEGRGGLFVEAHGHSEMQVRFDLEVTLSTLISDRANFNPVSVEYEVIGITCHSEPVCALAMAVFESDPWSH